MFAWSFDCVLECFCVPGNQPNQRPSFSWPQTFLQLDNSGSPWRLSEGSRWANEPGRGSRGPMASQLLCWFIVLWLFSEVLWLLFFDCCTRLHDRLHLDSGSKKASGRKHPSKHKHVFKALPLLDDLSVVFALRHKYARTFEETKWNLPDFATNL